MDAGMNQVRAVLEVARLRREYDRTGRARERQAFVEALVDLATAGVAANPKGFRAAPSSRKRQHARGHYPTMAERLAVGAGLVKSFGPDRERSSRGERRENGRRAAVARQAAEGRVLAEFREAMGDPTARVRDLVRFPLWERRLLDARADATALALGLGS
jgi:hypothetical protein